MKRTSKITIYLLTFSFILFGLSACFSKKYVRIAKKYEEVELYQLAVDNYITSLEKKSKNNDVARIGLMRASQRYLNDLEYKINDAYNAMQDEQVVGYFFVYEELKDKASNYQVELDISQKAQGQYSESKSRHLRDTYTLAQELLDKEDFYQAEKYLVQILRMDPTYERTKEFYLYARSEPIYREALILMDAKRYRSAYLQFIKLESIDANYKDVVGLKLEALKNAMLTVAIQPIKGASSSSHLASQVEAATKEEFLKGRSPFIRIVAVDHLQQMLAEQRKALANNLPFDDSMLIPVRIFLSGNIIESSYKLSKTETKQRSAYLRYEDKKTRKTSFKKINYSERTQSVRADIQYRYDFIRVEGGTIVANGNLRKSYNDNVKYAVTSHDISDLFPFDERQGKSDTIYTDYSRVNNFRSQFSARTKLTEKNSFESEFANYAAYEMYKKISSYDPEL